MFDNERERERKRKREREEEINRKRERDRQTETERDVYKERKWKMMAALKGMMGALAPFSYLVFDNVQKCLKWFKFI